MRVQSFTVGYLKLPLYRTFSFPWRVLLDTLYKLLSTDVHQPHTLILSDILLATIADAYQVTDGTGAMRAEFMNEQEKDMLFHPVSGSGQMNNGQWRLSLT